MSESSTQSFVQLLERSGIIAEDRLKTELTALTENANGRSLDIDRLTRHLLDAGLITNWHLEKLLAGKYKGFFLGKYKLLGHLGTGGMSSVYLAEHRLSGQLRAIKVLPRKKVFDKSYLDRFYLEARAAASLDHPNVVRIYDICNEGDTHYMVMEYVQGLDLYEIVKAQGPLPFNKAVEYCAQAAEGLSHAHRRELVHRDIKPANLLLTNDGVVKILDLGLALVNQEDSESLTLLYNERVMGTADYLSPEQAVNSHNVDRRADIYSLGCTLYFLLTGHPPFPKGTLAQRIAMHQTQEPADVRESRVDCPEPLVEICRHMMKKNVHERYQNCVDVKVELLGWLETGRQLGTGIVIGAAPEKQIRPAGLPTGDSSESPFTIDTSASSTSSKSSGSDARLSSPGKSSGKSGAQPSPKSSSKKMATSGSFRSIRRKAPPKWVLPVVIIAMFLILIAVLYLASLLIQGAATTHSSPALVHSSVMLV